MKYLIFLVLISHSLLPGMGIHDIQFTTDPGMNGTYPSPYEGQTVSTGGIVSGTDYNNGRFFLSSSGGGAWNGIFVYDNNQNVSPGDSLILQAEVYEYYGFTELRFLDYCNLISAGHPLPLPAAVSTQSLAAQEDYESVLVEVNDVIVTQTCNQYNEWQVVDGSGSCVVGTGFFDLPETGFSLLTGYPFASIKGVVSYDWNEYKLNPRDLSDLSSAPDCYLVAVPDQNVYSPQEFSLPLQLAFLGELQIVSDYQFHLHFNEDVMVFTDYDLDGTLSTGGTVQIEQPGAGELAVYFSGNLSFHQVETLLKLKFSGIQSGTGNLHFTEFIIGTVNIEYFSIGQIVLQLESLPSGDTLTIIQRPLLNIPALAIPGDELPIVCLAEETVTGWHASLQHGHKNIPLNITNSCFNSELSRWQLTAEIPVPEIYELYDLVVGAEEIATDTTQNAVKIIPACKESYYFVHITDIHLPTTIYYPDPLSLIDSTSIADFREVIRDINLINPEFVLLTGDLVNEGEMEDFENRRVYTIAQKMLTELEVPVFLTSGNHDIGGWDASPPPQGTARRNWWKFFGWKWLEDPPAAQPYYTQNYSFDYGPVHFTALEAYENYDNFMYDIYGSTSFTTSQLQWLADDLQQSSSSLAHVLFHHFDFADQLDLVDLEVDMALWGHIHQNSGNLNDPPFNLSTRNVCHGNRAYRVIYVEDAVLQPTVTIYAGANGNNLQTTFTPENNGLADSVYCFVHNYQSLPFPEAQL
ncbi:MAG: metallophosphoesterase, partial [Candidatus Cloacimonetes bacterium]|nr:metallophosphoesterase [Candidatus Cloacimonadota bacterium]